MPWRDPRGWPVIGSDEVLSRRGAAPPRSERPYDRFCLGLSETEKNSKSLAPRSGATRFGEAVRSIFSRPLRGRSGRAAVAAQSGEQREVLRHQQRHLVVQAARPISVGADARYVFNASGQTIDREGLLCLCDAEGPCTNAVKDTQRTKTHGGTRRTLSIVWGPKPCRAARVPQGGQATQRASPMRDSREHAAKTGSPGTAGAAWIGAANVHGRSSAAESSAWMSYAR